MPKEARNSALGATPRSIRGTDATGTSVPGGRLYNSRFPCRSMDGQMKSPLSGSLGNPFGIVLVIGCMLSAGCQRDADGGLLVNPGFDRGPDGAVMAWAFNQHTGEPSYSFAVDDGKLIIQRVGRERWGQAVQTLPAAGLAGRTLRFSAEISGELSDESGAPSSPTGVGVRISGTRRGMPAALGATILSTRSGQPAIGVGAHGWTEQSVVFEVPESATEIQLSLRLTLDGTLRVRDPRLIKVAP